jgi:hypothetical protein
MSINKKLKKELKDYPNDVVIFTNGAFLTPVKLANGKWGWVVSAFEDSSFYDGSEVNVNELWSDSAIELAKEDENEEEEN